MLAGELKFYKNGTIIKTIDSEEYDHFNSTDLKDFVGELAADKVVENRISHNYHYGIDTTIFSIYNEV